VNVFYIHAPDDSIPSQEWLPVVDELYKVGVFKRFGLSNFYPEDVQDIYDYCKQKGYVLPSVYQGSYNPVARKLEEKLLPTLKKLGISFYAYSPIAGGFLTKTRQQFEEQRDIGRFAKMQQYKTLYLKESYLDALGEWERMAKEEGCAPAELAYRW
jgi:aflatoxin B1 aldehyde reductase